MKNIFLFCLFINTQCNNQTIIAIGKSINITQDIEERTYKEFYPMLKKLIFLTLFMNVGISLNTIFQNYKWNEKVSNFQTNNPQFIFNNNFFSTIVSFVFDYFFEVYNIHNNIQNIYKNYMVYPNGSIKNIIMYFDYFPAFFNITSYFVISFLTSYFNDNDNTSNNRELDELQWEKKRIFIRKLLSKTLVNIIYVICNLQFKQQKKLMEKIVNHELLSHYTSDVQEKTKASKMLSIEELI